MSVIGTPDFQRGVASAQVLLAAVPAGTDSVDVGVPPNVETLIVLLSSRVPAPQVICVGDTTGIVYPGMQVVGNSLTDDSTCFFFDVTASMDDTVRITIPSAAASAWWVYADQGVHLVADFSKLTNYQGMQYIIPCIPGSDATDHPPNEISTFGSNMPAPGTVIGAPGSGNRIRLFYAGVIIDGGSGAGYLTNPATGVAYCMAAMGAPGYMPFVPQGVSLPVGQPLNFANLYAANSALVWGGYSVEAV